jgi:hypothetical protein
VADPWGRGSCGLERSVKDTTELLVVEVGAARQGANDEQSAGRELGQAGGDEVLKPAAYAVTVDSRADPTAGDEAGASSFVRLRSSQPVHHQRSSGRSPPPAGDDVVLRTGPDASPGGQHARSDPLDQADRTRRPLERRPARMARPARVRMRSRKPWVLARRRLFGWKVRLLTTTPQRFEDKNVDELNNDATAAASAPAQSFQGYTATSESNRVRPRR